MRLDAPVSSHEPEEEFGGGLLGGQGGQTVDGLVLDFSALAGPALALDTEGHLAMGQASLVGVGRDVEHPAAALLEPSVSFVRGAMLAGAHLGSVPIEPWQVGEQVGAVALDRGHHVVRAALLDQAPGGLVLGMHRVEGHDAPAQVQLR